MSAVGPLSSRAHLFLDFFLILGRLEDKFISEEGDYKQGLTRVGCSEFDPCQNTEQSSNAESWFTNRNHINVMNFKALMSHLAFMEAPGPPKQHMLYKRAIKRSSLKWSLSAVHSWVKCDLGVLICLQSDADWLTWVDFACCRRDNCLSQLTPNALSSFLVQESIALTLWTAGY